MLFAGGLRDILKTSPHAYIMHVLQLQEASRAMQKNSARLMANATNDVLWRQLRAF